MTEKERTQDDTAFTCHPDRAPATPGEWRDLFFALRSLG